MIPKIVHQTWKTATFDYWVFQRSQASVRRHLPHWDYRFWTDADLAVFVHETYPDHYGRWSALDVPIKRVDVARYFLLHHHGGLYADLDFLFTNPVDELLDGSHHLYFYRSTEAIVKGWQFLGNAFMISAPGESFWMGLVDFVFALPADTPVLHHTGPRAVGAYYETLEDRSGFRIFGPDEFDNDRCAAGVGEHRYGYHMRAATWQRPEFVA
jgi:mannosyltransferase OCH1-like enzyme